MIVLTSCNSLTNKNNLLNDPEENMDKELNSKKERMEIRFSCGEDEISSYTKEGWIIVEEYSEEKICTWKSFPASRNCNMEKDKGCKITKPDKIGIEKIYILEK